MRFFEIIQDNNMGHMPQFVNWYKEMEKQKNENAYFLSIKHDAEMIIPELLVRPEFLLNKELMTLLKKYEPNMVFEMFFLADRKIGKVYDYYRPIIPLVGVVEDGMKQDKAVFMTDNLYEKRIIVRLDFVESILRRDAAGFGLKEV